jgi:O-antigen/teichoic acid export membrane protein
MLIRLSLPLGLVAMLGSLMVNIPRYFIERSAGMSALAVYSAMGYIMLVGGMANGALLQAAAARLARYYVEDLRQFRKLLLQLASVAVANGTLGVLAAALFGRQFLTIVYRPEYARYPAVFTWLMVAATGSYLAYALSVGLAAARKFDVQLVIYLCGVVVTTSTSLLLVPRYGLQGAATSLFAGMVTWCVGLGLAIAFTLRPQTAELSALKVELRT